MKREKKSEAYRIGRQFFLSGHTLHFCLRHVERWITHSEIQAMFEGISRSYSQGVEREGKLRHTYRDVCFSGSSKNPASGETCNIAILSERLLVWTFCRANCSDASLMSVSEGPRMIFGKLS